MLKEVVVWAGSLTPTTVRLAVQPAGATATLVVSTSPSLSSPLGAYTVTQDDFVVDVEGLAAETRYYYGLSGATGSPAEFRTPSHLPSAFRVAVGACSWSAGNGNVFKEIAGLNPRPLVISR